LTPSNESAIIGNEDWKAAISSEVFRGYLAITLAKEAEEERIEKEAATEAQKKLEEENKAKFKKDTNAIMGKVEKAEDASDVPQPIIPNLPYDGDTYQEHVKRTFESEKRTERGSYDEFFPDYKVYHHAAGDIEEIVKMALDEAIENINLEKAPEAGQEAVVENEDIVEPVKEQAAMPEKENQIPKAAPKKVDQGGDLYHTNAGESKFFDVGLTDKTENSMEIDYVEKPAMETKPVAIKKSDDEIKEAEKSLGLDKNAFYIFNKMRKNG